MVQQSLKTCINAKYYKHTLEGILGLMVRVGPLKKLGDALMPFNAANTPAQKDIDAAQNAFIKAQGVANLYTAASG